VQRERLPRLKSLSGATVGLLDISKMETRNIELEKKLVSPKVVVDYSASPFEVQLGEKNIILEKVIDPEIPDFLADTEKISWVLINFLSNAIRYTELGGKIVIEAKKLDQEVEFSVKDFGPGIASQHHSKVFQRFVQLQSNGVKNEKGLGLGLAISKEVITEHKGEIGVDSEIGQGSRFYFRLPLETT
jgi:signal transduction histidine kinase